MYQWENVYYFLKENSLRVFSALLPFFPRKQPVSLSIKNEKPVRGGGFHWEGAGVSRSAPTQGQVQGQPFGGPNVGGDAGGTSMPGPLSRPWPWEEKPQPKPAGFSLSPGKAHEWRSLAADWLPMAPAWEPIYLTSLASPDWFPTLAESGLMSFAEPCRDNRCAAYFSEAPRVFPNLENRESFPRACVCLPWSLPKIPRD